MPEPAIYMMRGTPSLSIADLISREHVRTDFKEIARLSPEQIEVIRTTLSDASGFLDASALLRLLHSVLQDEQSTRAAFVALKNLLPEHVNPLLSALAEKPIQSLKPLDGKDVEKLRTTLPALIRSYPAISRQTSAERLAGATGCELESIELVSDLRPVFNDASTRIEGLMPYTHLRVSATSADGMPKSIEAILTYEQVSELAEQASKTKVKLKALCDQVEAWLPGGLPNLPLTRPPAEGAE